MVFHKCTYIQYMPCTIIIHSTNNVYIHKHSVNKNNTSHNNYKHCHNINSLKKILLLKHTHICHAIVSTQCLPHWFNHLHWNTLQRNNSNKCAPGQSSSEGVYCSLSFSGLVIEPQPHALNFSWGNSFFYLLPLFFTKAILDKERAWNKQMTLPHTGLLYQCSMSTMLPVEYINVCSWAL